MVIGITITNTLRDHLPKLTTVYRGVTQKEPINLPINPYALDEHFPTTESGKDMVEFNENIVAYQNQDDDYLDEFKEDQVDFDVYQLLFVDGSFEIFGGADEVYPGVIGKVSTLSHESEHEIILINMESPRSKNATLYFLSKNNFDMKRLYFPSSREEMWEALDVLVTDDPKILACKPEGKKSIKILNGFNKTVDSDLTVANIKELVENFPDTINKL